MEYVFRFELGCPGLQHIPSVCRPIRSLMVHMLQPHLKPPLADLQLSAPTGLNGGWGVQRQWRCGQKLLQLNSGSAPFALPHQCTIIALLAPSYHCVCPTFKRRVLSEAKIFWDRIGTLLLGIHFCVTSYCFLTVFCSWPRRFGKSLTATWTWWIGTSRWWRRRTPHT